MQRLSPLAKEIFYKISEKLNSDENPPTIQELVKNMSISTRKVVDALRELEDSLVIKKSKYKSRSIEIITPIDEPEPTVRVPILGTAPGGPMLFADENQEDVLDVPRRLLKGSENIFLLRVTGNSMSPYLEDGDLALIRQQSTANNRDIVVAVRPEGGGGYEATIKEFYQNENQIILNPLNKEYLPIVGTSDEISVQGKVVGAIKFSFSYP